jgi:hypothetical protein
MAAQLLAPAVWNGFPFVFADTGGYLARPHERTLEIGRSALYGVLLATTQRWNFWPAAAAQCALTAWMVLLVLRVHGLRAGMIIAISAALAVATSLPWYAPQLMPDIFLPLAVLAIYLLAFHAAALTRWERIAVAGVIAVAIASHMAILVLTAGLLVFLALWRAASAWLPPPRVGALAIAVLAGALLALTSNWVIAGRVAFTPGGANFVFGRLLQDGIVARYLSDRCPDPTIRLCEYRDRLPDSADGFLWGWDSPLYKLGGADAFEPEARRIVLESLRLYPGQHFVTAARATAEQLVRLRTGEGLHSRDNEHAHRAFVRYASEVVPAFDGSRQQRDAIDFTALNWLHVPVAILGLIFLPVLTIAGTFGRLDRQVGAFALTALAALLLNAAISGVLSNPNDRYQSRIAWLAPLVVAVALAKRRADAPSAALQPPPSRD